MGFEKIPGSEKAIFLEPEETILGPGMPIGQTNAMPAILIDMQIKGHSCFSEPVSKLETILHRNSLILPGMPDKTGWSVRADLQFIGKRPNQGWIGLITQQILLRP